MNPSQPLVMPLARIRATDLPLVGGKGANLGELAAQGFPVPEGFCVTTVAFRQFVAACPQAEALYAQLDALRLQDLDAARQVGAQMRAALLATPIPEPLAAAILAAWRVTGTQWPYAVRSSATAEDLPDASFAGQQDTYLNVRDAEALLEAVRRAWASLFTDRAILYRLQQGFDHRRVALAVVVQRMVPAEKSGILFTADPVSGHRYTMVINASFGLGEAIVAGLVTPDTYRVDKRTGQVLRREIEAKALAILPRPEGGTRQVNLPPEQQRQPTLSAGELHALTDLGRRVEAHYGKPQDIEWAFAEGQLYLLQSRPITTLYPIEGLASPDGSLRVYFSVGHQQGMTRAMAPLSLSSFPVFLPVGRDPDGLGSPYLRASGGRLFIDITPLLRHPLYRRAVMGVTAQFDALAPAMLRQLLQRPGLRKVRPVRLGWAQIRPVLPIARRVFDALWRRDLTGFVERINALQDDIVAEIRRRLQAAPPGKAQLEASVDILHHMFAHFMHWVPEAGAGLVALRLLPRLARRYLPPEQAEALGGGIPGNVVNEMNLALGDLADLARQSPALVAHFAHLGEDASAWLAQAATLDGAQPFLEAWKRFLARYGMRGPGEIDIAQPRWREDPLPLLQVLAAYLQKPARSHRTQWERLARAREQAYQTLQQRAGRGPLGPVRRWVFARLYETATQVGGMREHHKFLAVRILWEVKQALRVTAEHWVRQGRLSQPEEIWFLEWRELLRLAEDPSFDGQALAAERQATWARYQRLTPPIIITSEGETPIVEHHAQDMPPNALVGQPVAPGVAEGVARVVRDPTRERLAPGEILVAEFTDPGWTPLFINAAGVVLEVGGSLTHGAVVAREYGIPAVVGVREATRRIRTGERLRVDGNRGVVERL